MRSPVPFTLAAGYGLARLSERRVTGYGGLSDP